MNLEITHPITNQPIILESVNPRRWNYGGVVEESSEFNAMDLELCHILLSTTDGVELTAGSSIFRTSIQSHICKSIIDTKLPNGFIVAVYDIHIDGFHIEHPKTYGDIFKMTGHGILLCDTPIAGLTVRDIKNVDGMCKYHEKLKYRTSGNILMFGQFIRGKTPEDDFKMVERIVKKE